MSKGVSVVIPAYNEQDNVAKCLTSVSSVIKKLKLDAEVIVVDDGSTDQTGEIARKFIKKIPNLKIVTNHPNRGYGGSLKAGFAKATKELIAFFPADNQFDFSQISLLLEKMKETSADIVSGMRIHRQDPRHRRLLAWMWNTLFVSPLFGFLASDIDCGFKLFRRSILKNAYIPAERGAMIDTQLFASVKAHGHAIAEVPLAHYPRTSGVSTGASPKVIIQSLIESCSLKEAKMFSAGKPWLLWPFWRQPPLSVSTKLTNI